MKEATAARQYHVSGMLFCAYVIALLSGSAASAQKSNQPASGGVAKSGMEHGEAKISVQSSVRMSIKGERATSSQRLDAIGAAVGERRSKVQECYAKSVSSDPTQVGMLEIAISFTDASPKPGLEFRRQTGFDAKMKDCVRETLEAIRLDKELRPAAAIVTLEFSNSRAQGQQVMQERMDNADAEVSKNAEGKLETRWSAPGGKVALTITAEGSETKELLVNLQGVLKTALGAFLDCRRRAGKLGASPAGDTAVRLTILDGGRSAAQVQSSSIRNPQAVTCIEKVFGRFSFEKASGQGRFRVQVGFYE